MDRHPWLSLHPVVQRAFSSSSRQGNGMQSPGASAVVVLPAFLLSCVMKPSQSRLVVPPPRQSQPRKAAGGRPPKYSGPSRPITVTLPEKTLNALERIHHDRGQAIVKLADAATRRATGSPPMVEIVEMVANTGLLVVGPSKSLRRIPFLHLVEVAPARFLLALEPGHDFKSLELSLRDVLDEVPEEETEERELIRQLLEHITLVRKSERVRMAEILFVALKPKGRATLHSLVHAVCWLLASAA